MPSSAPRAASRDAPWRRLASDVPDGRWFAMEVHVAHSSALAGRRGVMIDAWPRPFNLEEKARENLEAVDRLRADEDGVKECLANTVASRAYYAAYLAVAHVAQQKRFPFDADTDYYRHHTFPDFAARHGILTSDSRLDLEHLRDLRIRADYKEDPVELEEAELAAEMAREL